MPLVDPSAITATQKQRMAACGRPLILHRESGAIQPGRFSCNVRWCAYCQRQYRNRVFGALTARVSDSDETVMLTLTAPPPMAGLGDKALRAALEQQREMWREAASHVRWWKYRRDRGRYGELEPPRLSDGAPHPQYASTYTEDWPAPSAEDGYAWALEVTTGKSGRMWHVHRHGVCSSRAVADRLNAAWQVAAAELGIDGRGWAQTDIRTLPSGAAAWYLAAYISSKNEPDKIPPMRHADYTRVMRDTQRHNAGGSFRPLGIARKPSDDPVLAVELPGYPGRYVEPCEFYGGTDAVWDTPRTGDDWRADVGTFEEWHGRLEPSHEAPFWGKHQPGPAGRKLLNCKGNSLRAPPA